jgi:hypothetical protein
LVSNIRESDETLELHTNGGILTTNLKCDVPQWGEAWYNPKVITNIFSYSNMKQKYTITSDSAIDNAFTVHLPGKKVIFVETANGLHIHVSSNKVDQQVQMIQSISENKRFFTTAQFEQAKKARDMYHALGTPSVHDFKAIIRMNAVNNNSVTTYEIEMTEKIFRLDISALKGKMISKKHIPVVDDVINIPRELIAKQNAIRLCVDSMNVSGLNFITTISKHLHYRTAQYIMNKSPEEYANVLNKSILLYRNASFLVTHIYCDDEFRTLMTRLLKQEPTLVFNFANPRACFRN